MITLPIGTSSPYNVERSDSGKVAELFAAMRQEQAREDSATATAAAGSEASAAGGGGGGGAPPPLGGRSLSSAAALTALPADISPCSSHFFEVLYIGKIKVSHKKVPDTFIDDALEKFRAHELEKSKLKTLKISSSNSSASELFKTNNQNNCDNTNGNNNSNGNNNGNGNDAVHNIIITLDGENGNIRRDSQDSNCPSEEQNNVAFVESTANPLSHKASNENSEPTADGSTSSPVSQINSTAEDENQTQTQPSTSRSESPTQDTNWTKQSSVQLEPMRNRAASTGSAKELKKSETSGTSDHNRIMLFQVGRTDLHLISPDRKQILLHKHLKDVASCIQGIQQADHFGFICRESNVECYIAYVFKCQSESVADDVVAAITQAFLATSEAQRREKVPVFSCEHCPMMWYHKLCSETEGLNDKKTTLAIFRKLELLPDEEQSTILMKFRGAETNSPREQNEFLMMLLRAHCESKQSRHVHDTAENRHEFLNQYLGGSTIFMKAKRSLTSSFDQLLKRKGSRDDFGPIVKELSLPLNAALCKDGSSPGSHSPTSRVSPAPGSEQSDSDDLGMRRRSSTVGTATGEMMKKELQSKHSSAIISPSVSHQQLPTSPPNGAQLVHQKSSPMMNIFFKVGNTPKTSPTQENHDVIRQSGSWRQAIFNRVVTPSKSKDNALNGSHKLGTSKRDKNEFRALWKKAINQQVLLIRMEKENARLRARQEEVTVKRIKLEYEEISPCKREVVEVWDLLISKESRITAKCDSQMLLQAIKQGVPRSKRGEVWQFLAEQHCLKMPPIDAANFPNYNIPYETLLKQLTSHPHNILVDLGRTFPGNTYFASPLGPGQLALFNLLKAYSLLDPEVGYCQGLNFVAGVLLLHMSEDLAFFLLKHLMFRRGLRRQYLPDMAALQVQLYQLSRLLHDLHPDLYLHFDTHEIAPTLYAAPWILTVFASQFPLGFVTRVFDLIFLESPEVIFRVALSLLGEHKEGLLLCENFEEIMGYLKTQIPNVNKSMLDKIMKEVFTMNISKQLHEYEVEYHVLQEEMASPRPEYEDLHRLEEGNKLLTEQNQRLTEQVEIATSNIQRLETARTSQQASINRLESQIRSLEVSILAMGNFISSLTESRTDIEIPGDVRRIVSQLSIVEQRRNSSLNRQNFLNAQKNKGVPLKVIDSGEVYATNGHEMPTAGGKQQSRKPIHQLKSTVSSPNLSARLNSMSSFFVHSHNNNKQQPKLNEGKLDNQSSGTLELNKSLSTPPVNKMASAHDEKVNGNLTEKSHGNLPEKSHGNLPEKSHGNLPEKSHGNLPEKGHGHLAEVTSLENSESQQKGNSTPVHPTAKLKPSLSAFELRKGMKGPESEGNSSECSSNQIHPLDTCLGVNFSYGGTTKLKTIRPLRAQLSRNPSSDSLKVAKNISDAGSSVIANSCSIAEANSEGQNDSQTVSTFSQSHPTLLSR